MWGLRRGRQWITAPNGQGQPGDIIPPKLTLADESDKRWLAESLDQALERQQLLRMAFGIATEIRAVRAA